jgi:hypothetical protein
VAGDLQYQLILIRILRRHVAFYHQVDDMHQQRGLLMGDLADNFGSPGAMKSRDFDKMLGFYWS